MTYSAQLSEVADLLMGSRRPIFIWGAGIRPYAQQARAIASYYCIPVACTWGAIDLMHHDDPLMAGGFGTHGTRAANFAVQNSDLVISIGSRLDTKATANPVQFARAAKIVMVDIDEAELRKFETLGKRIDVPICLDAGEFMTGLMDTVRMLPPRDYHCRIREWRDRYDVPAVDWPGVNPYQFMKELGQWTTPDDVIVSDTGTVLGYLMQSFPFKGERFIHAFNMTPMGYGLPAAVGASFAAGTRVVCVVGDGSIMMSLPELATIKRWDLNIKVILLNNHGHRMCVQTENQWFESRNASTTPESGLGFPDFQKAASAFGIRNAQTLQSTFENDGAAFLEVEIPTEAHLIPQARFGAPLEDAEPLLPREEFRAQMIVPPL